MSSGKGISLSGVKIRNRQQIKWVIYHNAPVTRNQITDELGLTLPTITTSVAEMLADGLLIEYDEPDQVISPAGGRRAQVLDFNEDAYYAVGVEIGPYQTLFSITNLRGKVSCEAARPMVSEHYEGMLYEVAAQILKLVRESDIDPQKIFGIGVGIPGFIESGEGIIRKSFFADWEKRPFAKELSLKTGMPVWIDNNARMRAYGKAMFGKRKTPDTFAYLFISKGLSCPLMIKHNVLAGHLASAGEIGHTTAFPGGPVCPTCGRRGCLESVVGEKAILGAVNQAVEQGLAPMLAGITEVQDVLPMTKVLKAQTMGDLAVGNIMQKVVEYLGIEIANIFNFISPSLIIVDGYIFENEVNRQRLLDTAYANLYGLTKQEAQIEFIPYNCMTGSYGSAAFVIRQCLFERK